MAQLLTHTSGLQAETGGPWWERVPGAPFDDVGGGSGLGPEPVRHRAGRRFHYSNVGFAVLGRLVEQVRGRPWGECLREEVLDPLGMRRTTLRPVAPHAQGWAVHPYADVVLPEPEEDAGAMAPAGQVWSTVADLARLAALLTGGAGEAGAAVVAPETVAEMAEAVAVDEELDRFAGAYGLGLSMTWVGGRRLVGHGGSMPGFLAGVTVDRDSSDGVVVLANATTGLARGINAQLLDVLAAEEPVLPAAWRPAVDVDPAALELVGPWYWGPAALVLRLRPDGLLQLGDADGRARASRFRPLGEGTWLGLDGYYAGEVLRVVRGGDGAVRSLDLASFVLTRTPYDPAAPVPGGVDEGGWR